MKTFCVLILLAVVGCSQINNYPIYMHSQHAYGLSPGSPVHCMDIDVGKVKEIVTEDNGEVRITLLINAAFFIPNQSIFTIKPINDQLDMVVQIESVDSPDFLNRSAQVEGNINTDLKAWNDVLNSIERNQTISQEKLDSFQTALDAYISEVQNK